MLQVPTLVSDRAIITILRTEQATQLAEFYARNRQKFKPWFPKRPASYYTSEYWQTRLETIYEQFLADRALCFSALSQDQQCVLAVANFTAVTEGAFKGCYLHFAIDNHYEGQGLMQEILCHTLNYIFCELDLHRIIACYPPANQRAHKLLAHLGFEQEGFARSYLKLDDQWQDHHLTSLINPLHDHAFN
ncbi:GNAT family N-acetyltransferase [Celerinatantimonas yamalensis]|uniref:GNAT family N-acetyltransferase n=1 Tax=Celerinatantimonas yamalensis TaxID=559956 RepID=A0ABW9G6Z2_9GAMM